MKKTFISLLLTCIMVIVFMVGCGSSGTGNNSAADASTVEIVYADQDFIADLAKGLEARWALNETDDDYIEGTEEHRQYYSSLVNAELDILADKQYENALFEDGKLKEKAISYLNCLHDQKDALTYVTVDYDKYEEMWTEAFNKRTQLITDFVKNYGLTVTDEYKTTLNDIITNASVVEEEQKKEKALQELVDSISFEKVDDEEDSDWKTYKAVVENTMDYEIVTLGIDVNLIDEDGINVDTEYVSMENITNGEKGKLEFSTDEKFEKTKLTISYFELK